MLRTAASGDRGVVTATGNRGYATATGEKLDLSKVTVPNTLVLRFPADPSPKTGRLSRIFNFFRNS